jgi:hypothetical protein
MGQSGQMIEHCPDCHFGKISLRKGMVEHVLHSDGSLNRNCQTKFLSKNAQLQATVNCSGICN